MPRQFTYISEFTAIDDRPFLAMRKVRIDDPEKRANGGVWVPLSVTEDRTIEDIFAELTEYRAAAAKFIELADTLLTPQVSESAKTKRKQSQASKVEAAATTTPTPSATLEEIVTQEAAKTVDDPTRLSGTEIRRKAKAAAEA